MKILIFWDIYWRVWRTAFKKEFPKLKEIYSPEFVIANVENISSWRWPIEKHLKEIEYLWIDVYTSWNHIFDNENDIVPYLEKPDSKLIRPANFYESKYVYVPWKWYKIIEKNWKKLLVINIMSQIFMRDYVYNPFLKIDEILQDLNIDNFDWIIIDFHKETTSEWYGMWMFLDWKISFLYGTHTHIQTNDELILPKWTWILTDIWMCWPLYSIIWADYESMKKRFLSWITKWKIEQSLDNNYIISWVYLEIDETSKKALKIEKIKIIWTL